MSGLEVFDLGDLVTIWSGGFIIFFGYVIESAPERLKLQSYFSLGNRSVYAPSGDPWSISSDDVHGRIEELRK
ncbi:MAG: hypothetical protein GY832_26310 [Chloroflexi bacterium]|nr:hypothetical protein [Chloroflexota bacterium]